MPTQFSDEQVEVLLRPLASARVAKRSVSGSQMSYLQAWDVRAHLIRMFGFGGFDIVTNSCDLVYEAEREIGQDKRPGYDIAYKAHVTLTVNGEPGNVMGQTVTYSEFAIGNAVGPAFNRADLHDNAAKSAVSDAMKRCAINLGTQFGLSLYNSGQTNDIVRKIVGRDEAPDTLTPEQAAQLQQSLGATPIQEEGE
jgi:recombination DNA repair RAD52 pathway protein